MISAFGVEHVSGISKMSNTELRHRKRVQAGLSTAGAVVGLSALGAKGVKVGTGKYLKPAAKAVKINTKIDNGVNNALVVGGGIGGAAGLNSASISRAESKKPHHIHKIDTSAPGSNQHRRQVRIAVPRVSPKQRRHTALAASTGMLAGAGLAAGGNKKKLAVGLIAGGSALSGYAASDPNDYIREKKVSKSAFGIAKADHLNLIRQRKREYTAANYDIIAAEQGRGKHPSRPIVPRTEHVARIKTAEEALHASMQEASIAGHSHQEIARAAKWPIKTVRSVIRKSAFGVDHDINKAFDPEARRHTQLGAAAGVSGSVAAVSGASALKSGHKARGHFRAASGANLTTKGRLLEGLHLKGAAQTQHARKTAVGHGEMLRHIRAGNTAAHRARGRAGVALGAAAATGAIVHHSNNGAANYVGPYQPKAKYAQGAKKTVTQIKRRFS